MEKVALIGLGVISESHVVGWQHQSDVELAAVVDIDPEVAARRARQWKVKRWETDYRQLLNDDQISICDICLPHHLHAPVILDFLKAGKHVLCEKPIALSISEAQKIIRAWRANSRMLMIAENWYYLPTVVKALELQRNGVIGTIYYLNGMLEFDGYRADSKPNDQQAAKSWRDDHKLAGGGILIDSGIHVLSVARLVMGEVDNVCALGDRQSSSEMPRVEDSIDVALRFQSGARGYFHFAEASGRDTCNFCFSLYGTAGLMELDILKQQVEVQTRKGREIFETPAAGGMIEEIDHFMTHLVRGTKPLSDPEDQTRSLALVSAAYASMARGGVPIKPESFD